MSDEPKPKLPLIGRDRFLVDKYVRALYDAPIGSADFTPIRQDSRGCHFEVKLPDSGLVVRVTVELDRFER